jgi:chemotaxis methyl-accepting protein methylase
MDRLQTLQTEIVPLLRTYARFNVWVPNCGDGDTIWSVATTLREGRIWQRVRLYATDASDEKLARLRAESEPSRALLSERIVFAQHHLDNDASFNEFALIFCPEGQPRWHKLYDQSLCRLGILSPGIPGPGYQVVAPGFFRKVR